MNVHAAAIASSRRAYACMQQSPASSIGHSIGPADRDRLCRLQRSLAGCPCYCVLTLRDHTLPSGPSFEIEPEEIKRGSRQAMRESRAARLLLFSGQMAVPARCLCVRPCVWVCVCLTAGGREGGRERERERERVESELGNGQWPALVPCVCVCA